MNMWSKEVMCFKLWYYLFFLSLSFMTIVISLVDLKNCNNMDKIGLNVSNYLLGFGLWNLVNNTIFPILIFHNYDMTKILLLTFITTIFGMAWFVMGAFVLLRANFDCIKLGAFYVVYALFMWCISGFQIINNFIFTICNELNYRASLVVIGYNRFL